MAQPAYAIQYLGAYRVEANIAYTSASILAAYPTATVMKAKLDDVKNSIKVSVNGAPMFEFTHNEEAYIVTGSTYTFSEAFTIAIGIYKAVV